MPSPLPYCGSAPSPGELLGRFNLDPVLIAILVLVCLWQVNSIRNSGADVKQRQVLAFSGWLVAAAAFLSPLCALSVALFSARVGQHMLLILVAAPLIAVAMPGAKPAAHSRRLWLSASIFFVALWYWHMPAPYDSTFASVASYWCMHLSLFGSAILLWRELLNHPASETTQVLMAGTLTFVHMGLLGAVLTFANRPLFRWHLLTTWPWGLSPLQDQQLGGALMWVPGIGLFLWTTLRSLMRLWESLERTRTA